MKHVFKAGGEWKNEKGVDYTVKAVSDSNFHVYLTNGWYANLDDALAIEQEVPEQGSDYEANLREEIKALGGKPGGRSSIETLEKQLKELKDGSDS